MGILLSVHTNFMQLSYWSSAHGCPRRIHCLGYLNARQHKDKDKGKGKEKAKAKQGKMRLAYSSIFFLSLSPTITRQGNDTAQDKTKIKKMQRGVDKEGRIPGNRELDIRIRIPGNTYKGTFILYERTGRKLFFLTSVRPGVPIMPFITWY
jgi:hypothetical protein